MIAKVFAQISDEKWLFLGKNRLEKASKAPTFA